MSLLHKKTHTNSSAFSLKCNNNKKLYLGMNFIMSLTTNDQEKEYQNYQKTLTSVFIWNKTDLEFMDNCNRILNIDESKLSDPNFMDYAQKQYNLLSEDEHKKLFKLSKMSEFSFNDVFSENNWNKRPIKKNPKWNDLSFEIQQHITNRSKTFPWFKIVIFSDLNGAFSEPIPFYFTNNGVFFLLPCSLKYFASIYDNIFNFTNPNFENEIPVFFSEFRPFSGFFETIEFIQQGHISENEVSEASKILPISNIPIPFHNNENFQKFWKKVKPDLESKFSIIQSMHNINLLETFSELTLWLNHPNCLKTKNFILLGSKFPSSAVSYKHIANISDVSKNWITSPYTINAEICNNEIEILPSQQYDQFSNFCAENFEILENEIWEILQNNRLAFVDLKFNSEND